MESMLALAGTCEGDLLALAAALPLLGVGGAVASGWFAHRLPGRGRRLRAAIGCAAAAGLAAAVWLWHACGAPSTGAALGAGWWGAFVTVDAHRLLAACVLTQAALLAYLSARVDKTLPRRSFAGGIAWLWALGLWIVWLDNGPARAWACTLWALSLPFVVVGSPVSIARARAAFAAAGAPAGAALLWLCLEASVPGAAWPRTLCAVVWVCALPLPGMMRLWSEGFAPGFLFAQCAGGVLAVLLAGGGGDAPWAAGLCAAAALAAGLGACLAQQAGRFAAFALIAFLQQGAAAAFLGDPASALLFMTFFPLGAFALYAVARAGRREGGDIRERAELRLPKWAGWCLTAALCGILGGILPGPVLAVRLRVLAELWEGGAWGLAGTAALLGSVCCLLIGSVRWTAWRDGGPSAPVPRHVRAALWACLAALIAPAALQLLFLRGFVPASGWFLPLAVLAPAAALACLVRWGTGDGVTRLWSWTSPAVEDAVYAASGPAPAAALLRAMGAAARAADGALRGLAVLIWALFRAAGTLARELERGRT